jgi:hypothetical protein
MQLINRARLALPAALLIGTGILAPAGAFAHEHRDSTNGMYTMVVGWQTEPPIQGQANAATIRISLAGSDPAQPVEGAEQTLHLQVRRGDMAMDLPLHAVSGQPGKYSADITPDEIGDVQWVFSGSINGDVVDETFDTADGKFDAVKAAAPMADAPKADDTSQLSATLDLLARSGLHDLDLSIQSGTIPAGALERVHQVDTAFGATAWPVALQGTASQLDTQLGLLHEALEANDMDAAMQPAHDAHELSHAFSSQARAWLASQSMAATAAGDDAMPGMDHHDMSEMAGH